MTRRVGTVLLAAALAASLFLPWSHGIAEGAFFNRASASVSFAGSETAQTAWRSHGWLAALLAAGAFTALLAVAEPRLRRVAAIVVSLALGATLLDLALDDELVAWGVPVSIALATALVALLLVREPA
jgi:hypothetical protein